MLYAELGLSKKRVDVCLLDEDGGRFVVTAGRLTPAACAGSPGVSPAYTIVAAIGETERFAGPKMLCGFTGLCPRVCRSGASDRRGPLAENGLTYLRWELIEAAVQRRQPQDTLSLTAWQLLLGTIPLVAAAFVVEGDRPDWISLFIAFLAYSVLLANGVC